MKQVPSVLSYMTVSRFYLLIHGSIHEYIICISGLPGIVLANWNISPRQAAMRTVKKSSCLYLFFVNTASLCLHARIDIARSKAPCVVWSPS